MKANIVVLINSTCISSTLTISITSMYAQPVPIATMATNNNNVIDQTTQQQFEKVAIRRLIRKLDWRLLPFMLLIEIGSYINRISTGRVALI